SQYFVPTLTAISLAGDRAGGRLGPLLASRMPLNAILIGKLMAPALPFGLLLLGGAILLGPPAVIGGAISAETVLYVVVLALPWLFVTGMVGLRVGASARHTTAAVGGSLVIVLLVLPGLHGTMYYLVLLQLLRPVIEASRTQQAWWQLAAVATHVVFSGLIFAALWFSTKRALARAAE
ncbi:MAG: hypothetical protein ACE5JM_16895, partial [Armatimonadota bacterium]